MNRRDFLCATAVTGGSAWALGRAAPPVSAGQIEHFGLQMQPLADLPRVEKQLPDLQPAKWIWFPCGRCLPNTFVLFRRSVVLPVAPRRAHGWVIGDSRYRLDLNGERVQWGPAPSDPRWAEADPVDLTHALRVGENVLGATVLYYGHGDGTWPIGKPGFLFWLAIEHFDGRKELVVSDASWQSTICRAWSPGHYKRWFLRALQEEFDARLYPQGWNTAGHAPDESWLPAMEIEGSPNAPALATRFYEYTGGFRNSPAGCELRPRSVPLLREVRVPVKALQESLWVKWKRPPTEYFESRTPQAFDVERAVSALEMVEGRWRTHLDGVRAAALTFDLPEQLVGFPYFTIDAPAGTVIELMVQEAHEVGGPPLLNTTGRDAWARFTCREGENYFECFDYESLRWLQLHIRGTGTVTVSEVGVRRRIFPWPHSARVETADAALQLVFKASINTLNNSALDTIVDGSGRERQQYSGDCGHQLHPLRLAFGEVRSSARFLSTFSQGQSREGYFLDAWPAYDRLARIVQRQLDLFHFGAILDHGVQFNFDCWDHYLYTGRREDLAEAYPRLLKFATFLATLVNRDGDGLLPVEDMGIPCVWLDYQAYNQQSGITPPFTQRRKQCAFNLYVAAMFQHALAPICRIFDDRPRADQVMAFGAGLERRTTQRFWCPDRRTFLNNLPWLAEEGRAALCDRSLATAVLFNQCPDNDISASIKALAECPREMGLSYPANAVWRLRALAQAGRIDVVLADLRTKWANMPSVKLNNALQEGWGAKPDSASQWSHCAQGPLYLAFAGLAGICPLEPGFRRVEIRPQLGDLSDLALTAWVPSGGIRFEAAGPIGGRLIKITLPPNCAGELVLPAVEQVSLDLIASATGFSRYALPAGRETVIRIVGA